MSSKFQAFLLLVIIVAIIGGFLYFAESEGLVDVSGTLKHVGLSIPYVDRYIAGGGETPRQELAELERFQEEKARLERWNALKKTEEELRGAQENLNAEKQRLAQWEGELERREEAISEREKEFSEKEKQYEQAVKFYLTMKPAAAAKILAQQEDILVIEIFRRMPERNVSSILSEMDPAVAAAIMRKMAR